MLLFRQAFYSKYTSALLFFALSSSAEGASAATSFFTSASDMLVAVELLAVGCLVLTRAAGLFVRWRVVAVADTAAHWPEQPPPAATIGPDFSQFVASFYLGFGYMWKTGDNFSVIYMQK